MTGIAILDEYTAGQIAAGEVVERPVSAVKELLENALDAGATKITVDLAGGGLERITVSDNGCGMTAEDVRLAFLRHATSKIRNAFDLCRVTTLGFRGEALPSIAAVAKVTMTTCVAGALGGTCAVIQGGSLVDISPAGCPPGTVVEVKDLFYNTPARRKTMKSPAAEGTLCGELLAKMALARPGVRFELINQGRRVFYSAGTGRLIDAVASVYGPHLGKEMIAVNAADRNLGIKGYAGKPSLSRSSRSHLTVIINGRYVRCPSVVAAVEEAYRSLLPQGRKPVAVLSLTVAPEQIDVNVHPAKLEVRLLEEKRVANLVAGALQQALRGGSVIPSAVSERSKKSHITGSGKGTFMQVPALFATTSGQEAAIVPEEDATILTSNAIPGSRLEQSFEHTDRSKPDGEAVKDSSLEYRGDAKRFPDLHPLAQLLPTYILAGGEDGLYIIDQHAAHERVLYEEYLNGQDKYPSQCLLAPVAMEFEFSEMPVINDLLSRFSEVGFIIEHFGGNTFLLRGAPSYLPAGRERELLLDIVDYYKEKGFIPDRSEFLKRIVSSIACKGAIKAGAKMPLSAMESLLARLARAENPFTCPHGRPTIIHLSYRDLESRFQR